MEFRKGNLVHDSGNLDSLLKGRRRATFSFRGRFSPLFSVVEETVASGAGGRDLPPKPLEA